MAEKTKKTRKVEEIVPDAARTVASLRDIGYDTPRAIADLVDNSIAAGATEVDVTFTFAGEHSWIRVTDNGAGMDGGTLQAAVWLGPRVQLRRPREVRVRAEDGVDLAMPPGHGCLPTGEAERPA
jgi:hypothetical protein